MTVDDWCALWHDVAGAMAAHRKAGRGHLLTEDVLRFATVLALGERGVPPSALRAEVLAPELKGGKVDLAIETDPAAVVEFKFPRDPTNSGAADTMTLGEVLRDFYRLALLPTSERWVVLLLDARLLRYVRAAAQRYDLGWADDLGSELTLTSAIDGLPKTARDALGAALPKTDVTASCLVAADAGPGLTLLAYRLHASAARAELGTARARVNGPSVNPGADIEQVRPAAVSRASTARSEILDAVRAVGARSGRDVFTPLEVVTEMRNRGSRYAETTIRTMITAHMCSNAPDNAATTYDDLERLDRGHYRLRRAP
jgi:hypothetical protein